MHFESDGDPQQDLWQFFFRPFLLHIFLHLFWFFRSHWLHAFLTFWHFFLSLRSLQEGRPSTQPGTESIAKVSWLVDGVFLPSRARGAHDEIMLLLLRACACACT